MSLPRDLAGAASAVFTASDAAFTKGLLSGRGRTLPAPRTLRPEQPGRMAVPGLTRTSRHQGWRRVRYFLSLQTLLSLQSLTCLFCPCDPCSPPSDHQQGQVVLQRLVAGVGVEAGEDVVVDLLRSAAELEGGLDPLVAEGRPRLGVEGFGKAVGVEEELVAGL